MCFLEAPGMEPVDDAVFPVRASPFDDQSVCVLLNAHAGRGGVCGVE